MLPKLDLHWRTATRTTPTGTGSLRGRQETIRGTTGDDVLRRTNGADVISAGAGSDVITARNGRDVICAGLRANGVRCGYIQDRGPDKGDRRFGPVAQRKV